LLGEVITKTKNKKSLETIIAFTGISLTLIFNSWSLNRVVEHNVYKKNYYSPRVITALKTPIEEITDIEMKTHLFCHRTRKECEILVLRMRCFSETHPKAICINGSKEELIGLIKRVN